MKNREPEGRGRASLRDRRRRITGAGALAPRVLDGARRLRERLSRARKAPAAARDGTAPDGSDWRWRPLVFRAPLAEAAIAPAADGSALGPEVTLFHDGPAEAVGLRQVPRDGADAPFGVRLETDGFDGSYLSLVVALPPSAATGLARRHVVFAETTIGTATDAAAFLRLCIRHGPNVARLTSAVAADGSPARAEFDLAYTDLDASRVEALWIELIVETPGTNTVTISELSLGRRPRAPL